MIVYTDSSSDRTTLRKAGLRSARLSTVPFTIEKAVNLQRDPLDPAILRPAGIPSPAGSTGALPVARFTPPEAGTDVIFWLDGLRLFCSQSPSGAPTDFTAPRTEIGTLPAAPLEFLPLPGGVVKLLLTHHAPAYLVYDSSLQFTLAVTWPRFPAVTIHAAAKSVLRARAAGCKLTGTSDGRAGGTLSVADNRLLAASALSAYRNLSTDAATSGLFIQPVLARYRFLDPEGATLACGPWVMPSAGNGFQCTGAVSFPSSDSLATAGDAVVQARSYVLSVGAIPALDGPWRAVASRFVVEVTGQMEPVDAGMPVAPGYVSSDASSGETTARVYLPGCSADTAAYPGLKSPLVTRALAGAESSARAVLDIPYPFRGCQQREVSARTAQSSSPVPPRDSLTSYSASLADGSMLFLANPRAHRLPPVSPAASGMADSADTGGRWCVEIATDRGAQGITVFADSAEADGALPSVFSPLLTVYDPEATALTLRLQRPDGTAESRVFPLTPLPYAGLSYYLAPDLRELSLQPASSFAVKFANPPLPVSYGTIHCCVRNGSCRRCVASEAASGEIIAMRRAPRTGSSWDFARTKLLLFGPSGTEIATFSADGSMRASAQLDPRPVTSPSLVAGGFTPSGGACIIAAAGNDLIRVLPSRCDTLRTAVGAVDGIGSCSSTGDIWLKSATALRRVTPAGEIVAVEADGLEPASVKSFGRWENRLLLATSSGLFDADKPLHPSRQHIGLTLRGMAPGKARSLVAWLSGSFIEGTLTVAGDNGTEIPETLCAFSISGEVNAPLSLPLRVPFRRFITLRLSVDASPDTTIRL